VTGEFTEKDSYRIGVAGEGEATHLILKIMVWPLDHSELVIGPELELQLCDVSRFIGLMRESNFKRATWRGDASVLTVMRLDDGLMLFKTRAPGGSETSSSTMTLPDVARMLADLKQARDAIEDQPDTMPVLLNGATDVQRQHDLN
jgi:hypothetical protein